MTGVESCRERNDVGEEEEGWDLGLNTVSRVGQFVHHYDCGECH